MGNNKNNRKSEIISILLSLSMIAQPLQFSAYAADIETGGSEEGIDLETSEIFKETDTYELPALDDDSVIESTLDEDTKNISDLGSIEEDIEDSENTQNIVDENKPEGELVNGDISDKSGKCGATLNYEITGEDDDLTLTITGEGAMNDFNEAAVASLYPAQASPWMRGKYSNKIKHIEIEEGITYIGQNAFEKCAFDEIEIPDSVTTIGKYAFNSCENLKKVAVSDNLEEIGVGAFNKCTALDDIYLPNNTITVIPNGVFSDCTSLKEFDVPEGVSEIGIIAFSNCTSLSTVVLPASLEKIDNGAFSGCTSLKSLKVYNNVTEIWDQAFMNTGLESFVFPQSTEIIRKETFKNTPLQEITLSTNVSEIETDAFSECTSLRKIFYEGAKEDFYAIKISDQTIKKGDNISVIYNCAFPDDDEEDDLDDEAYNIENASLEFEEVYGPKAEKADVKVTINDKLLTYQKDYELEYSPNYETAQEVVTVSVNGIGKFKGHTEGTYIVNNTPYTLQKDGVMIINLTVKGKLEVPELVGKSVNIASGDVVTVKNGVILGKKPGNIFLRENNGILYGNRQNGDFLINVYKVGFDKKLYTMIPGEPTKIGFNNSGFETEYSVVPKSAAIASIDDKGVVTLNSDGKAQIIATVNGRSYKTKVAGGTPALSQESATLLTGTKLKLKVTGTKEKAIWTSSNPKVATVNNGKVQAISKGKATILATAGGKTLTCDVFVSSATPTVPTLNLNLGESKNIALTGMSNPNHKDMWEIKGKAASISPDGEVFAQQKGKATAYTKIGKKKIPVKIIVSDVLGKDHVHSYSLKSEEVFGGVKESVYMCACNSASVNRIPYDEDEERKDKSSSSSDKDDDKDDSSSTKSSSSSTKDSSSSSSDIDPDYSVKTPTSENVREGGFYQTLSDVTEGSGIRRTWLFKGDYREYEKLDETKKSWMTRAKLMTLNSDGEYEEISDDICSDYKISEIRTLASVGSDRFSAPNYYILTAVFNSKKDADKVKVISTMTKFLATGEVKEFYTPVLMASLTGDESFGLTQRLESTIGEPCLFVYKNELYSADNNLMNDDNSISDTLTNFYEYMTGTYGDNYKSVLLKITNVSKNKNASDIFRKGRLECYKRITGSDDIEMKKSSYSQKYVYGIWNNLVYVADIYPDKNTYNKELNDGYIYGIYTLDLDEGGLIPQKAPGEATITMQGWVKGEAAKNPVVESEDYDISTVVFKWYDENGNLLAQRPGSNSPIGKYYVEAFFEETENFSEYTTDRVAFQITEQQIEEITTQPMAVAGLVYNEEEQELIVPGSSNIGTFWYSTVSSKGGFKKNTPTKTDAGEYNVWYYLADEDGTRIGEIMKLSGIVIEKGAGSVEVRATNPTYTGAALNLVEPVSSTGAIYYSLDKNADKSDFTKTIPTKKTAGEYIVYYYTKATLNRNETEVQSIVVPIRKAANKYNTEPTPKSLTYNGSDQVLATTAQPLNGTVTYALTESLNGSKTYGGSMPKAKDAGTYYLWYKTAGDENHEDIDPTYKTITIAKKEVTFTTEPRTWIPDLTYNKQEQTLLSSPKISEGKLLYSLSKTGIYSETIPKQKNADTYTVFFKSSLMNDPNYETPDITGVYVTIKPKEVTLTQAPAPKTGLTYNGNEQVLATAGKFSDVAETGPYAGASIIYQLSGDTWSTTIPKGTNAGTYYLHYAPAIQSDKNYRVNFTEGTITPAIGKAKMNITFSNTSLKYDGKGHGPTVTVKPAVTPPSTKWVYFEYSKDGTNYYYDNKGTYSTGKSYSFNNSLTWTGVNSSGGYMINAAAVEKGTYNMYVRARICDTLTEKSDGSGITYTTNNNYDVTTAAVTYYIHD